MQMSREGEWLSVVGCGSSVVGCRSSAVGAAEDGDTVDGSWSVIAAYIEPSKTAG
jgi:hypothetical protein